jgi:hypothetical protein
MARHGRRLVPAAAAVLISAIVGMLSAASGLAFTPNGAIQPKQYFTATVNGSSGRPHPAVIRMACFGPIRPGQTGHPFSGQTVSVTRVAAATPGAGYTGVRATAIGAFFGAPPPSGAATSSYVNFTHYGQKAIPTSLQLPCAGTGQVTFVPLPLDPSEHDFVVPVSFVGQP